MKTPAILRTVNLAANVVDGAAEELRFDVQAKMERAHLRALAMFLLDLAARRLRKVESLDERRLAS